MGRPKKTLDNPGAKKRIAEAFWTLLESHRLHEITVGMITAEAKCNRGTFYYHFTDMDDLIYHVLEQEMMNPNSLPDLIIRINSGASDQDLKALSERAFKRIHLLLNRGGMDLLLTNVLDICLKRWTLLLHPEGGSINPQTTAVLEYCVGGAVTLFAAESERTHTPTSGNTSLLTFLRHTAKALIESVCESEKISPNVLLSRIATACAQN